jgi:MFS family permease
VAVSDQPDEDAAPRPRMLDALREPRFRRLWLAGFCVNSARWLDVLVAGWLVLELSDSPLMVGMVAFCRTAPMILLGLFAGLLADRFHRGRLMQLVQFLNLGAALLLALLFATGHGGVLQILALEIVLGCAWAIDFPVRRTVFFSLVGPGRVTNAVSLDSVTMQGSKMIGPVVGGLLLAHVGSVGCYVTLAVLFGAALALNWQLYPRLGQVRRSGSGETILGGLASGLREARHDSAIFSVLIITVLMNMLVFPYQMMMPVFARDVLHVGPELLGLLTGADGLGSMSGSLLMAARHGSSGQRQIFVGGSLLVAMMVICLALSPIYALSLLLTLLIGMAQSGFGTMQSAIVLINATERSRGRLMGILSVCIGTQPVGTLGVSFLASIIGAPLATAAFSALALVLMLPVARRTLSRPGWAVREAS